MDCTQSGHSESSASTELCLITPTTARVFEDVPSLLWVTGVGASLWEI